MFTLQNSNEFFYVLRTVTKSGKTPKNLSSEFMMLLTKEITKCFLQTGVQWAYNAKSFLQELFLSSRKNN